MIIVFTFLIARVLFHRNSNQSAHPRSWLSMMYVTRQSIVMFNTGTGRNSWGKGSSYSYQIRAAFRNQGINSIYKSMVSVLYIVFLHEHLSCTTCVKMFTSVASLQYLVCCRPVIFLDSFSMVNHRILIQLDVETKQEQESQAGRTFK